MYTIKYSDEFTDAVTKLEFDRVERFLAQFKEDKQYFFYRHPITRQCTKSFLITCSMSQRIKIFESHFSQLDAQRIEQLGSDIIDAVKENNQQFVRQYLSKNPELEDKPYLLVLAAENRNLELVRYFIEELNVPWDAIGKSGVTALYTAAKNLDQPMLQYFELIEANFLSEGIEHKTLLHSAYLKVNSENKSTFSYLISLVGVNSADYDGNTILHIAVKFGMKIIFTECLRFNPDINAKNKRNQTVSEMSEMSEISEIEKIYNKKIYNKKIINIDTSKIKKIKIKKNDKLKEIDSNNIKIKKTKNDKLKEIKNQESIIANFANLDFTNGDMPDIILAIEENDRIEKLKLSGNLINNKAIDNGFMEKLLNTRVHEIILYDTFVFGDALELLVEKISPISRFKKLLENYDSKDYGDKYQEEFLFWIERGADPLTINHQDWLLIHYAAFYGNYNLLDSVLQKIPDSITLFNSDGESCLHLAIKSQHLEIVKYLLQNYPNSNVKTEKTDQEPFCLAIKNGYSDFFSYLLSQGIILTGDLVTKINNKISNDLDDDDEQNKFRSEIEKYVNLNKRLHTAVISGDFEQMCKLLELGLHLDSEHDGKSILFTSIESKQWKCCAYLMNEGSTLTNTEKKLFEKLTIHELNELKIHLLSLFSRPAEAVVNYFVSRTRLARTKKRKVSTTDINNLYKALYDDPFIKPIMDCIECSSKAIDIILDYSAKSISNISPSHDSRGICNYIKHKIFIGAGVPTNQELQGTLAHELTHLCCQILFNNKCFPYEESDLAKKDEFQKIVNDAKQKIDSENQIDQIIQLVFKNYSAEDWPAELIVRVPHMRAQYGTEKADLNLKNQLPELFDYFEQSILIACNKYIFKQSQSYIQSGTTSLDAHLFSLFHESEPQGQVQGESRLTIDDQLSPPLSSLSLESSSSSLALQSVSIFSLPQFSSVLLDSADTPMPKPPTSEKPQF